MEALFADLIIAGLIVTLMGLPIAWRNPDGSRVRLPKDPRAMRSHHGYAYVGWIAWHVGRTLLAVGVVGWIVTAAL